MPVGPYLTCLENVVWMVGKLAGIKGRLALQLREGALLDVFLGIF